MTLANCLFVFFGLLLLRSAVAKLREPATFWSILRRYPGAGLLRSASAARLVPALELTLAMALLSPFPLTRGPACWVTMGFISLASVGIYRRYRAGEARFACGCSGRLEQEMPAPGMLLRNGALLIAALYAVWEPQPFASPIEYAMGFAMALAFDVIETVAIQRARIREWKVPG